MSDLETTVAESEETGTTTEIEEGTDASAESTTEASAAEGDGTSEDKWLVPNRFRTAEDVLNSYKHLEATYSRTANELHNIKQRLDQNVDPKAEVDSFVQRAKENPVKAIKQLAREETEAVRQEMQSARFETKYNYLKDTNTEFKKLEPVMTQLAQDFGDMIVQNNMQNDPRLLDILFLAAKGQSKEALVKTAESNGKKAGELGALKKSKLQVEGNSGTRGHVKKDFDSLSLEEMRKELEKGSAS